MAIAKNDLAVWIRSPLILAVTLLPSIVVILVLNLASASVGSDPVALVVHDHGPAARVLVRTIDAYGGYTVTPATAAQAAHLFSSLKVAAVITIPKGFSGALAQGQSPAIGYRIRNFSADSTGDLKRSMAVVMKRFLVRGPVFSTSPLPISVHERDTHPVDAGFVAFMMTGVLAQLVLLSGVINAALASVREWERRSVKELLLAPIDPGAFIAGKVASGVIASFAVGAAALLFSELTGLVGAGALPGAAGLAASAAIILLLGIFASGVGVAIASAMRQTQKVIPLSINLAFYLFFLSGGIAATAFFPSWLQSVASVLPTTYAMDGLRASLLYHTLAPVPVDLMRLGLFALLGLAIGIPFLRRGLAH